MFEIVQVGEPTLRQVARTLSPEEIGSEEVQALIEVMGNLMREAPGVGLAAPQIGVPVQLVVIEDRPEYIERLSLAAQREREREPVPFHVLINPTLTVEDDTQVAFFEGCLSFAGYQGSVRRYRGVRVDALDEQARPVRVSARGWYARILQHEIDHLHGILCVDRMDLRTLTNHDNYSRHWQEDPAQVAANEETDDVG